MTSTPLTAAFPKLAAQIDAQRPLISAALLDIRVTAIGHDTVAADVIAEHSHAILTSPSQQQYLNESLSHYLERPASFLFHLAEEKIAPSIQPPATSLPKRTANTLTFTARASLQNWMNQPANTGLVAMDSDTAAAAHASRDLDMQITAGNIASMRKILGIEKIKPTKPDPSPVHDIDLVALHARVEQHHFQLAPIAGISLADMLTNLRDSIHKLEQRLDAVEPANN